ncbi:MAG: helix-turn-helix domain-containing protein [Candidatus Limnocylindrales bacterium]
MTARDQARPSTRRLAGRATVRERERLEAALPAPAPMPIGGPRLGELLRVARERKGVDLYRAERDTKIRAKFLAALEHGDFRDLPGAVYTKGFLRNYAIYLGLDPEAVLARWKSEVGETRRQEPTIVVPRLDAPRGGLTITRGIIATAILAVGVIAFASYIALQIARFQQPPALLVDQPAVSQATTATTLISGHSDAGATISIAAAGQPALQTTVSSDGTWQLEVPLRKGQNTFTVKATDQATQRDSPPVQLIVTVPIALGQEAPTLTVTSPTDATSVTNGAIPVQGTTNGQKIVVSATYQGPVGVDPGAKATPQPPDDPAAMEIAVDDAGSFSDAYQLAPGRWQLTITATDAAAKTTTILRNVSVAYTGVDLIVQVKGSPAWLKVWVDDTVVTGYASGVNTKAGKTLEFAGTTSVEVRTDDPAATYFTLNGVPLGSLGSGANPQTWKFTLSAAPEKTGRTN